MYAIRSYYVLACRSAGSNCQGTGYVGSQSLRRSNLLLFLHDVTRITSYNVCYTKLLRLSPCADLAMSPDQLLATAKRKELDIIAITDHNSTLNCKVVREIAADFGIVVLNGCEVNSQEDVHALCLFEDDHTRDVITSYSIHYTKLYERSNCLNSIS